MVKEINISKLVGSEKAFSKDVLASLDGQVIRDFDYGTVLGKVLSVNCKTKTLTVDIYDDMFGIRAFNINLRKLLLKEASLNSYKRECLKAAHDLGYDKDIIDKIENAKSTNQVSVIMGNARHQRFKY